MSLEIHPSIHNVSKTHEVRVMIAQQQFDLLYKMINDPDLPHDSISFAVREAIHSYSEAVMASKDLGLSPALSDWLGQQKAMSRWMTVQAAREGQQKLLRLSRDELAQLIEGQSESKMAKAYSHVESTLKDLVGGNKEHLELFLGLPVVRFIRQWKEGVPEGDEAIVYDMATFKSEVGIP